MPDEKKCPSEAEICAGFMARGCTLDHGHNGPHNSSDGYTWPRSNEPRVCTVDQTTACPHTPTCPSHASHRTPEATLPTVDRVWALLRTLEEAPPCGACKQAYGDVPRAIFPSGRSACLDGVGCLERQRNRTDKPSPELDFHRACRIIDAARAQPDSGSVAFEIASKVFEELRAEYRTETPRSGDGNG